MKTDYMTPIEPLRASRWIAEVTVSPKEGEEGFYTKVIPDFTIKSIKRPSYHKFSGWSPLEVNIYEIVEMIQDIENFRFYTDRTFAVNLKYLGADGSIKLTKIYSDLKLISLDRPLLDYDYSEPVTVKLTFK